MQFLVKFQQLPPLPLVVAEGLESGLLFDAISEQFSTLMVLLLLTEGSGSAQGSVWLLEVPA